MLLGAMQSIYLQLILTLKCSDSHIGSFTELLEMRNYFRDCYYIASHLQITFVDCLLFLHAMLFISLNCLSMYRALGFSLVSLSSFFDEILFNIMFSVF